MTRSPAPSQRSRRLLTGLVVALLLLAGGLAAVYYVWWRPVTVSVDGEQHSFRTRAATVRGALADAGITLLPADAVDPPPDAPLQRGARISVRRASMVAFYSDAGWQWVRTQSGQPLAVLAEHGITPGEHDRIEVNGQAYAPSDLETGAWREAMVSLRVRPSATIEVVDGGTARRIYTTETELGRALETADLALYLGDRITPDPSAPVQDGMVVRIERALPLTLIADGERLETRAVGPTVADALAAIGIAPIGQDYTIPALDAPLSAHMTIRVVRVAEQLVSHEEPAPFWTVHRPDHRWYALAWGAVDF